MEKDIQDKIDQYKQTGLVKDYMVTNAGNSVATQISQIQDIIQKRPNLLLVDAASSDVLNPVLQKAEQAGITVVTFDVGRPTNIGVDRANNSLRGLPSGLGSMTSGAMWMKPIVEMYRMTEKLGCTVRACEFPIHKRLGPMALMQYSRSFH